MFYPGYEGPSTVFAVLAKGFSFIIVKVQTGNTDWGLHSVQSGFPHSTAEKMAALRVVVLSGSGRALLSTPKTIKTPRVGGKMGISFTTDRRVRLYQ